MDNIADKIRSIGVDELIKIISSVSNKHELMENIGASSTSTFYLNLLNSRIKELGINDIKYQAFSSLDRVGFVENSKSSRSVIRKKVLRGKLIEYKCSECPIIDTYNGKIISLQLDHINGIRNDHRLENLRWICPNCHSQTVTYAGKRLKINKNIKCKCGSIINRNTKSGLCKKCAANTRHNKKKLEITSDELKILISNNNLTEIGRILGVSSTTIRKRCQKLKIEYRSSNVA